MTPDLTSLLEQTAKTVVERDFVDAAWHGARIRRRRRHLTTLGAAAAAAAVVAGVVVLPGGDGAGTGLPATPASGRPSVATWQPTPFDLIGVQAVVGPQPDQAGQLPEVDDATRARIQLPAALAVPVLPQGEGGQPDVVLQPPYTDPVRAVLLRHTGPGVMVPVLHRPTSAMPWVQMDDVTLSPLTDASGNESEPLGIAAISEDGRRIVLAQPGKVLLLDAQSGETRSFPVGDDHLEDAGWAADGATIVARSSTGSWRIEATTGRVERVSGVAYPGPSQLVVDRTGLELQRFAATGTSSDTRQAPPIFSETWGETVTSTSTWVASGGFVADRAQQAAWPTNGAAAYQGVFAVESDRMSNPRILLAPEGPDDRALNKGCCAALGWATSDQLLVSWGSDILLWDVVSGALARVSKVPVPVYGSDDRPRTGSLGSSFAIRP